MTMTTTPHVAQQPGPQHPRSTMTRTMTPTQHNDHDHDTTHSTKMATVTPMQHNDQDCKTTCGPATAPMTPTQCNEAHLCLPPPALLGSCLQALQSPHFRKHSLSLLWRPHSSLPCPLNFP